MLKIGTRVKIKQEALLNETDLMGKLKIRVNDSPLMNATGTVIGNLGDKCYVDLDNERLFLHDAQNAPVAVLESDLVVVL